MRRMLITILIFIALIAVLILVHEAGHFFTAKRAGIKVEEFGFGFPPRMIGFRRGETVYSLNWIPLGGFVKIFGEEGGDEKDPRSFTSRGAGIRALVIVAGIAMNLVLAASLFSIGHMVGLPTIVEGDGDVRSLSKLQINVVEIAKDSPAMAGGLAIGDVIARVDGNSFKTVDALRAYILDRRGKELAFEVLHDNAPRTLMLTPRENPPEGQGPLGFAMVRTGIQKLPWHKAVWQGVEDTFVFSWMLLKALGRLFADMVTRGEVSGDVTGPVGIAVLTGRVAKLGIAHLLQFAAAISVNLALINIFPIPALDGGRLLFILLEKLKGHPVKRSTEQRVHQIGFALLLTLMLLITVRDVIKLF